MGKICKKTLSFICLFLFVSNLYSNTVMAKDSTTVTYLDDGSRIETTITKEQSNESVLSFSRAAKTTKGSKTTRYFSKSNKLLWSVTVHGTFRYNGSTSSCTTSSVSVKINDSNWKLVKKSSSHSGKTATAKATLQLNGVSLTKTIRLSCSASGTLS